MHGATGATGVAPLISCACEMPCRTMQDSEKLRTREADAVSLSLPLPLSLSLPRPLPPSLPPSLPLSLSRDARGGSKPCRKQKPFGSTLSSSPYCVFVT